MVDKEVLIRKCQSVRELLSHIDQLGQVGLSTFKEDFGTQAIILFGLEKVAQDCIDLAAHVVSDQGWDMGERYRDLFAPLERHGVITRDLSEFMQRVAGFRNVLVHRYGVLSHEDAYSYYQQRGQLREFCTSVLRHFGLLE
ncbi:MAG: DUF86 domain-containing protein [Nitrospirae bacterium]|nr:DUF86 domain-containing protein [Nitrospirota bacterium]